MRTDVGERSRVSASTIIGEARVFAAADQFEVVLDSALARSGVSTEPSAVSRRAARDTRNVRVGVGSVGLRARGRGIEL